MNFWTAIEILGGLIALTGIITIIIGRKGVLQVLTSPYHIIKTVKINKPITFQTFWEGDC